MDTINVQDDLLRLRKRVNDLKSLGYMTPESAGTYEQTILLAFQEADRRRQSLLSQAETLKRQSAAAEAQAGAFATMASIFYSIVNGFVEAGQKRLQEEAARQAEREAEREAQAAEAEPHLHVVDANAVEPEPSTPIPTKRGRPKKDQGGEPDQKI